MSKTDRVVRKHHDDIIEATHISLLKSYGQIQCNNSKEDFPTKILYGCQILSCEKNDILLCWGLTKMTVFYKIPYACLDVIFQIENILVGHDSIVAEHHAPSSESPPQILDVSSKLLCYSLKERELFQMVLESVSGVDFLAEGLELMDFFFVQDTEDTSL